MQNIYCKCPDDLPLPIDVGIRKVKSESNSSHRDNESKSSRAYPNIRDVKRSPFERKDKAARAEFVKELEKLEIAEVEKKQKLKPRRIKKDLKKEGVYDTLKYVCYMPDSVSKSSRGERSYPSIPTDSSWDIDGGLDGLHSKQSESNSSSGSQLNILQLRKDPSVGSRNTAVLLKEEAFIEIELSEETDSIGSSRGSGYFLSSSSTEQLSSSSEISLRVNLDKKETSVQRKNTKMRNSTFVKYSTRANDELAQSSQTAQDVGLSQETMIIEKIAVEFGEWAKENGMKPETVEKDIIKELFQFGTMDMASNSISVEIKELVIVPESISAGNYPELEERAALYRHILFDEMAYWRTERSMAFGKLDPHPYKRPPYQPLPTWTKSGFVPISLTNGELLFKTLIDNESLMLEKYVLWMIENPKAYRPQYLINSGYFKEVVNKYGGSEDVIRQKTQASKVLSTTTAKNLAGLNVGMKMELNKLKDMTKVAKSKKA